METENLNLEKTAKKPTFNSREMVYPVIDGIDRHSLPLEKIDKILKITKKWVIPSMGKKPKSCAETIPYKASEPNNEGIKIKLITGNCKRPECPDCFRDWKKRATKSIFKQVITKKLDGKLRVGHLVVSPPIEKAEDLLKQNGKKNLQKKAIQIAKEYGVMGGTILFHPYRIKKEMKKEIWEIAKEEYPEEEQQPVWKTLIKLCHEKNLNWRDFVEVEPHFHIIGLFKWLKQREKGEKRKDGWMFKKVGKDRNPEGVIKTTMYLLSHNGINVEERTQNYAYFGNISQNKWNKKNAEKKTLMYVLKLEEKFFSSKDEEIENNVDENGNLFIPIQEAKARIKEYNKKDRIIIESAYNWWATKQKPRKEMYDKIMKSKVG